MDDETIEMLRQLFQGTMVKIMDAKNTGMFIKTLDYNHDSDTLDMMVYYFELKVGSYYSDADRLQLPFERFINEFSFWANQHMNENIEEAEWMPLNKIITM